MHFKKPSVAIVDGSTRCMATAVRAGFDVVAIKTKDDIADADFAVASQLIEISQYTEQEIKRALEERAADVSHIITFSEAALVPVARLSEQLGKALNPASVVERLKDKHLMRAYLRAQGVADVRFARCYTAQDVIDFGRAYGYPLMLKPIDGTGSENVRFLQTPDNAEALPANIFEQQAYLVEEYLKGYEVSVESFSKNGLHTVVAVTEKTTNENFVELEHAIPGSISALDLSRIENVTVRFLEAIGLQFGTAHTELMVGLDRIEVIESHNRVGGDGIPRLVQLVTGVDLYEWTFEALLDRDPLPVHTATCQAAAVRFITPLVGVVKAVSYDYEALDRAFDVHQFQIDIKVGNEIKQVRSSDERCGFVMVIGDNFNEVSARARQLAAQVEASVEVEHVFDDFARGQWPL